MSVAICRSSASSVLESILMLNNTHNNQGANNWLTTPLPPSPPPPPPPPRPCLFEIEEKKEEDKEQTSNQHLGQSDIWASIQSQKSQKQGSDHDKPYVHPLMRSSSSLLSQKSLEICTESLGSETGSDDYFSSDDETYLFSSSNRKVAKELPNKEQVTAAAANYHCSSGKRGSNTRPFPFPPPLPSISRKDGSPCLQMRPHRRNGRLVVEAVSIPTQNFLHAERRNGRLLLSFINPTTTNHDNNESEAEEEEEEVEVEEEDQVMQVEEEEEVQVVDRGTVVEVKVSTQPQQQLGGPATVKVHRSSIVINKFVSCNLQLDDQLQSLSNEQLHRDNSSNTSRKLPSTATTTAAAAAVAASSVSVFSDDEEEEEEAAAATVTTKDNKLLFTSKRRRNREELLHDIRRCSELKKPLFIWEPRYIATSS